MYKRQPLIVVNCIILGRAEMFASKNKVLPSLLDGLGMGVGFTATLLAMGIILSLIHIEMCIRDRVFGVQSQALTVNSRKEYLFTQREAKAAPPGKNP